MRGTNENQSGLMTFFILAERIPQDHPLRVNGGACWGVSNWIFHDSDAPPGCFYNWITAAMVSAAGSLPSPGTK